MELYKSIFYNENFYDFVNFFETISEKRNYLEASEVFKLDKSTVNTWHKIDITNEPEKSYKRLIAEFLLNHSVEKTRNFEKKYKLSKNPEDLVNDKIISLLFDMTIDDLINFKQSVKEWKTELINYFKTLNKELFTMQINILRYRLNIPTIPLETIKEIN
jgi:hypothetical protein